MMSYNMQNKPPRFSFFCYIDRHLRRPKKEEFSHGSKNVRDWSGKGAHLMRTEQEGERLEYQYLTTLKSHNKTIDLMLLVTDGTTWAIIQGTPQEGAQGLLQVQGS